MTAGVQIELQMAIDTTEGVAGQWSVPDSETIQAWADATLRQAGMEPFEQQMTVRIVDVSEMTQLNQQYRQKAGATNVLSFPFELPPGVPAAAGEDELGDLVICAAVVEQEAAQQHKAAVAHWAHMIVHGTLHLLGYDHLTDDEAQQMEMKEIAILESFGYANPYE